jgi:hypothetical protein
MKLSVKGVSFAFAIIWALAILLVGIANLIWPSYGREFLLLASSVYPGYKATASFGQVIIGTLYGLVDAGICGAIFAWLYNRFASA